jgi:hypothetical protein
VLLVSDQQFESALAHRGKMRAAGNEADVGARARELHTEISADRAGAVDTDFHEILRMRVAKISARHTHRL